MSKTNINEAASKYLNTAKDIDKDSEYLLSIKNQLIGAVGGNELDQIVSRALSAAANLIAFADSFIVFDEVKKENVLGNFKKVIKAANTLALSEAKAISESTDSEIFIDPYEAEYLPSNMCTIANVNIVKDVPESVNEDTDILTDDLDDDPDAVNSIDPDGMPVKFNNTPVELDPFAVKLFRNNSELLDAPEEFNPEQEAPTASFTNDPNVVDAVVAAVADDLYKDDEIPAPSVNVEEIPNDFDVTTESHVVPKAVNVLPPQFEATMQANNSIAENPGNNLKMLSFLTQDW